MTRRGRWLMWCTEGCGQLTELYRHYRILICGSRNWTKRKIIAEAIDAWLAQQEHDPDEPSVVTLIHGGASGADALVSSIANTRAWSESVCPAIIGAARGTWMPGTADICLAFPLGVSTHTRTVMALAEKAGIPVENHGDEAGEQAA